mgnify:CR=1 FL=1
MSSCWGFACAKSQKLTNKAMTGMTGPKGILNTRGASGIFLRKTIIERQVGIYCEKRETTLIEAKKANTLRMTYATKDATYIVAGYGTQPTSGYSIRVNDLYLGTNAVYADVDLLGPEAGEDITELPTTPYIVLKIQKREESVVFCM